MQQLLIGRTWHVVDEVNIPSFPHREGWRVVSFVQSRRHPRDCVVLCSNEDSGTDAYVVWTANTIEGGCHNGTYGGFDTCWTEFQRRVGNLS